ncbi:MAG: peptide ABC transporter permease, partial [Desulfuromonadales bacterium]
MTAFFREVLWTRLKTNRMAMAGALIVLVMFVLAALAPAVGRDPGAIDIANRLQPPSWQYPFGTDDL